MPSKFESKDGGGCRSQHPYLSGHSYVESRRGFRYANDDCAGVTPVVSDGDGHMSGHDEAGDTRAASVVIVAKRARRFAHRARMFGQSGRVVIAVVAISSPPS